MKTMELTINGEVYEFTAGFGFLREINSKAKVSLGDIKQDKNVGLTLYAASLIDGDPEALVTILDTMNKGFKPRVTVSALERFIEDEDTDIDDLFKQVIDFLSTANVSKRVMAQLKPKVPNKA